MLARFNVGDLAGAADGFLAWTKSKGVVLPGLVKRRQVEQQMFLTGAYPGVTLPPADTAQMLKDRHTLVRGAEGGDVVTLQRELGAAGYPDNTVTGGSARGKNAMDFQGPGARTVAAQVASGDYSFLGSGRSSAATGAYSTAMGNSNVASKANSAAWGGIANTADGQGAMANGQYGIARGRYGVRVFGAGAWTGSVQGAAQLADQLMAGSGTLGSSTVTVAVTADKLAVSTINGNNLTTDGLHYHMEISGACTDSTTTSHVWASWDGAWGDADRKNGDITYAGGYATATAPSRSAGGWSGATMQIPAPGTSTYALTATFVLPAAAAPAATNDNANCVALFRNAQELQ